MSAAAAWDSEVDLAVVGASAGGMMAAQVAAEDGVRVAVFEKTSRIGGAATSGSVIWGPCASVLARKGIADSPDEALAYLRTAAQGRGDEELAAAYVDTVGPVLDHIEARTPLRFIVWRGHGDYYSFVPGALDEGRLLIPHPAPAVEWLGAARADRPELDLVRESPHNDLESGLERFSPDGNVRRAWMGGRALVGGLLMLLLDLGVPVHTDSPAVELVTAGGRVVGLVVDRGGRRERVRATRGVLLACGGYEWDAAMMRRYPTVPGLQPQTPPANTGDGLRLAVSVGAATALMDQSMVDPCFRLQDETFEGEPLYRLGNALAAKPHSIVVNRQGRRFASEAAHYQLEVGWAAFDPFTREHVNLPAYLVFDSAFRERYGVPGLDQGAAPPEGLAQGETLAELADQLGVDAHGLQAQVQRFNEHAERGEDPDFRRGTTHYERSFGDPEALPNPTLGVISSPPYYGFPLTPAAGGTRGGVVITPRAEVQSAAGTPIPGLFACGNTAAQLMIGSGYTSGVSLGSSMVFGYLAAQQAARSNPHPAG